MVTVRRNRAAGSQGLRRQVSFHNGGISIKRISPPEIPPPNPAPKVTPQLPPPLSTPFAPFSAKQPPPLLSSFADLFKLPPPSSSPPVAPPTFSKPPPPLSSKDILPLPRSKPLLPSANPWIEVVNKKRAQRFRSGSLGDRKHLQAKKKWCFFYGNPDHMAAECMIRAFLCFKCKEIGHTFRSCPLSYQPPARPATRSISHPLGSAQICQGQHHQDAKLCHSHHQEGRPIEGGTQGYARSAKDSVTKMLNFAILTIKRGDPSKEELKDMVEFIYNVKEWEFSIIPAKNDTFLVEFPAQALLQ